MPVNKYKSFLSKTQNKVFIYSIGLAITYILLSPWVLGSFYDQLLFHPDCQYHSAVDKPLQKLAHQYNSHKQDIFIPITSKTKIYAWYFSKPGATRIFLISHGNAGNVCYRTDLIALLLNYGSVLIYDYEGYGKSDGKPSRQAICTDGLAAYDYLINNKLAKPSEIILYGESLGCAVSCQISTSRPVGGLILQSGWASLLEAARDRFVWLHFYPDHSFGAPLLDNVAILSQPHPPLLLIHGQQDNILPCRYSQEIFAKAIEPKQLVLLPNTSHNDVTDVNPALYSQSIASFLASIKDK